MTTETVTTTGGAPGGTPAQARRSVLAYLPLLRSAGILIPFVALFIVLSVTSDHFATKANLLNILDQQSATLVMAAAGTLVMISGGIDLSVGATYTLCAIVGGYCVVNAGLPIWLSVLIALATGLLVGVVNGFISTVLRINSLIATLAMSFIVLGIASKATGGNVIILSLEHPNFAKIAQSSWLGVRTSIWIAIVALVIMGIALSSTTFGRHTYAAGGNPEAARLAGVRVTAIRIATFAASGVAAAIAGIVDTSRTLSAQSSSGGASLSFAVLACIVVGGTSILGGDGAIWRTTIGVLFIALVYNGFSQLGVDPLYQQITLGVILLLAVGLDAWTRLSRR